jgi:hypothetical protein
MEGNVINSSNFIKMYIVSLRGATDFSRPGHQKTLPRR